MGTRKGGDDERRRAGEAPLIQEHHHGEGHGQLGTAGNAHDKRARNGVGKKGLEQIACCRERRPQQDHHDRPGEPQLQDDAHGERVLPFAQQGRQHGPRGQRNAAPQQIHAKQHQKPRREGEVGSCEAFGGGHGVLLFTYRQEIFCKRVSSSGAGSPSVKTRFISTMRSGRACSAGKSSWKCTSSHRTGRL